MSRPQLLTDEEIVARARPVFLDRGYRVATTQIAKAVGLTWGAIAFRFGSKEALFRRAMDPQANAPRPQWTVESGAALPELLASLRRHLWEVWPLHLQSRLAATAPSFDDEPRAFLRGLASVLESLMQEGSVRRDMPPCALAELVLTLVTGEILQRFIARSQTLPEDASFIDGVVQLLRPA
jgi:AcrR family transcriptional regulator